MVETYITRNKAARSLGKLRLKDIFLCKKILQIEMLLDLLAKCQLEVV